MRNQSRANEIIAGSLALFAVGLLIASALTTQPEQAASSPEQHPDFPPPDECDAILQAAYAQLSAGSWELPLEPDVANTAVIRDRVQKDRRWVQFTDGEHVVAVSLVDLGGLWELDSIAIDGKIIRNAR